MYQIIKETGKEYPILKGFVVKDEDNPLHAKIYVWCPFCGQMHSHGWRLGETKPTHRSAHCYDWGNKTGVKFESYMVVPFTAKELKSFGMLLDKNYNKPHSCNICDRKVKSNNYQRDYCRSNDLWIADSKQMLLVNNKGNITDCHFKRR